MRCVVLRDGQLRLEERDTPEPGPHDVVVAVRGAGVNAADLLQRQGFYPAPPGWPEDVPGLELAGVVTRVGDRVHEPLLGRRVCAVVGGGAQATHCVVPAEHLIFVPDHVPWLEAAGFAETFVTAYDALVRQAHLLAGERVLISGAGGGVGTAAVQLAHAFGAHVIAATRDATAHGVLRDLGAAETVLVDDVGSLAPVDVVLELVGAAHLVRAQRILRPFARVVVIGVGAGRTLELDLLALMATRASITGSTLRARSRDEKARLIDEVNHSLVPRLYDAELRVLVDRAFALDEVEAAYDYFARPGKVGKVVLLNEE